MANRLNHDGGKAISIGSSTTHDQDLRRDLDNRQTEDMHTRIERRRERTVEKAEMMISGREILGVTSTLTAITLSRTIAG